MPSYGDALLAFVWPFFSLATRCLYCMRTVVDEDADPVQLKKRAFDSLFSCNPAPVVIPSSSSRFLSDLTSFLRPPMVFKFRVLDPSKNQCRTRQECTTQYSVSGSWKFMRIYIQRHEAGIEN
ncbi:hypothetical protein M422DRAFT_253364 [Sphaerobolus stellatus SS14]|uniref:Unplaced genomic scaffold SPHSTscaffold_48, whole genome shotgun sequence n=1 Tax=Sphaerobolus stellatus (strain SS14) TaxID=990650 RepID=A0A0C9VNC9_SPHS4|nr:hypothetical protein M422DRAFT_253364 [Sphaerobolus stellatus SS14]